MKKIVRLTESDLVLLIKKVISEQNVPLLSVLSNPTAVLFSSTNDNKSILLSQRNSQNQKIPNSTYRYTFTGNFENFADFDIEMTQVQRTASGGLKAKVRPSNWAIRNAVFTFIPEVNPKNKNDIWKEEFNGKTWLNVFVSVDKLNNALSTLKNNSGKTALIDAGNGVSLRIKYAGPAA